GAGRRADGRPSRAGPPRGPGSGRVVPIAAVLLARLAGAAAAGLAARLVWRRAGAERPVRIIAASVNTAEEDPGCTGVALCGGPPPSWARGGLRGSVGRVRALPPAE